MFSLEIPDAALRGGQSGSSSHESSSVAREELPKTLAQCMLDL